ncbi:MAG: Membrane protein implicated in regulation of membrane protease activity [Rhodobacteraceae bacterium HLUCCA08]|nr:MAG: Membrane protein implicated in regulation of membrane protease activity [Rhodobacteraceae bacterium HLUCCA08]
MTWLATWWVWMCGAVVLGLIEVIVPGYLFLGFAIGALFVGILMFFGVTFSTAVVAIVFASASLVAFLALRRALGVRHGQVKIWDRDIND